jgi:molybdopterin-guanine dinucleotide biosynthesis protein MobB/dephospho-CoA kinase
MYTLYVTGGIGSGKSTALAHFASRGATIIDLDEVAHRVLDQDDVKRRLIERFGAEVADGAGRIDRPRLASRAFADAASAADLNAITHPAIRLQLARMLGKAPESASSSGDSAALAVVEVQVAEAADASLADEVMTLACPREKRRTRAIERGMDPQDFESRDSVQISDEYRCALADTVVDSSGTVDDLIAQLDAWYAQRKAQGWQALSGVSPASDARAGWLRLACPDLPSPSLAFVGRHNSGKTTLVVKVISELTKRGLDVGSVKHHGHRGFEIDVEGKDSWRHRQAGANEVAISAPDRFALIRSIDAEMSMEDVVACMRPHQIVVVEGYRHSTIPSVEVMRAANERDRASGLQFIRAVKAGDPFAFDPAELQKTLGADADRLPDERTVAIATDMPRVRRAAAAAGMRAFTLDDERAIADFIESGLA